MKKNMKKITRTFKKCDVVLDITRKNEEGKKETDVFEDTFFCSKDQLETEIERAYPNAIIEIISVEESEIRKEMDLEMFYELAKEI